MERGTIRIIDGKVVMPDSPAWMTVEELSDLFGICSYEIRKRLAAIYRRKEAQESETIRQFRISEGFFIEAYNIEVIAVLAFSIGTESGRTFRRFILQRLQEHPVSVCISIPAAACHKQPEHDMDGMFPGQYPLS